MTLDPATTDTDAPSPAGPGAADPLRALSAAERMVRRAGHVLAAIVVAPGAPPVLVPVSKAMGRRIVREARRRHAGEVACTLTPAGLCTIGVTDA